MKIELAYLYVPLITKERSTFCHTSHQISSRLQYLYHLSNSANTNVAPWWNIETVCGIQKKSISHFLIMRYQRRNRNPTRSIQRTQTPLRLWPLILWCDLSSRSRKLMSLDVVYCIVPWYQVWCLWVCYFKRYHHLFILCDLWPSPVTFSFCQCPLHFNHYMYFMLLNVCTKKWSL